MNISCSLYGGAAVQRCDEIGCFQTKMALPLFLLHGKCLVFSNVASLNAYKNSIRGLKSELNIKWIRPEKVSCLKPEKSGDLKPLLQVDKSEKPLMFQNSEELKT